MNEKPHKDTCRCTECAARWGRFWQNPKIAMPWFLLRPLWVEEDEEMAYLAMQRTVTSSGAEVGPDGRV